MPVRGGNDGLPLHLSIMLLWGELGSLMRKARNHHAEHQSTPVV
jgi:hypothetical protein